MMNFRKRLLLFLTFYFSYNINEEKLTFNKVYTEV